MIFRAPYRVILRFLSQALRLGKGRGREHQCCERYKATGRRSMGDPFAFQNARSIYRFALVFS